MNNQRCVLLASSNDQLARSVDSSLIVYVLDNRRAAVVASRLSDITGCLPFNHNL